MVVVESGFTFREVMHYGLDAQERELEEYVRRTYPYPEWRLRLSELWRRVSPLPGRAAARAIRRIRRSAALLKAAPDRRAAGVKRAFDVALARCVLADEALVLVDDWRYAADSDSRAKTGTLRAMPDSKNHRTLLLTLPARHNGDYAMWWNGVGVLSFPRRGEGRG